jgi:hypothetical protein
MELRTRFRHRVAADAMFTWESTEERAFLFGEGLIRDMSLSGAFISTLARPPVGSQVQLDLRLSPNPLLGHRRVRILVEGKVVRVEHTGEHGGFATTIEDLPLLFNGHPRTQSCVSNGDTEGQGRIDEMQGEVRYCRLIEAIVRRRVSSNSK